MHKDLIRWFCLRLFIFTNTKPNPDPNQYLKLCWTFYTILSPKNNPDFMHAVRLIPLALTTERRCLHASPTEWMKVLWGP